jgi:hypothetical protein
MEVSYQIYTAATPEERVSGIRGLIPQSVQLQAQVTLASLG